MAIEVLHQVSDEWLAELADDAAEGVVDRNVARVAFRYHADKGDPLATVTVEGGYSVGGIAVRLSQRVGLVPYFSTRRLAGPIDDSDDVLTRAVEDADALRLQVAELGLMVRGGRLMTVGQ